MREPRSESGLRVVMVIPSLGGTGGLERVATTLALGVAARAGRLVVCFARSGPHEETLRSAGIELVRIHRPKPRPDRLARSTWGLTRVLRRERPDVVHAHNPAAGVAASVARVLAPSRPTAVVTTFHGLPAEALGRATKLMAASSDLVVSVGDGSTRALEAAGLPAAKIETIANAVVAKPSRPRAEVRAGLGAGADAELVVSVGRHVPEKNQALLLEALAAVAARRPGLRAAIVGAGPLEGRLRTRAEQLAPAAAVTLTGERPDAVDLIAAGDVFALSSDSEGLPLALLEAMTLARPIVATTVGSIPDTVRDGETALLVAPGDRAGLAAAIERLLSDRALASRLGGAARDEAARRFSVETMVERTLAAYASAVRRRRARSA